MSTEDLSALDRTTLRLWRVSNLIGWGVVGAAVGIVTFVIAVRTLVGFFDQVTHGSPRTTYPAIGLAVVLGGVVAGIVIGGHVYRAPGVVTSVAILAPSVVLLGGAAMGGAEAVVMLALPAIGAAVASGVARARFLRRPKALRAPR